MIKINGVDHLTRRETKEFMGLTKFIWERYWPRLPYITHDYKDMYPIDKLIVIKDLLDKSKYASGHKMAILVRVHYLTWLKMASDRKIPTFTHPFLGRPIYRLEDIYIPGR